MSGKDKQVLGPIRLQLFKGLLNPTFASFINEDGYPTVVPVIQTQPIEVNRCSLYR